MVDNYLGKKVKIIMDRPLGSKHPEHGFIYPINYGYVPNTVSGDGEEIDAYILGEFKPLETFEGYVIAIIHRLNDNEDKLVVCKDIGKYNISQIRVLTEFQERFFKSEIITLNNKIKNTNEVNIERNFASAKNEVLELIKNKKTMVLATSSDDRVTARSVSCVLIDDNIYFQTDKTFLKYYQIIENINVAMCIDNIQIEGVANIKGHPLSDENKEFTHKFTEEHEGSFKNYSHMKNETVVEVELRLATLWKYIDGKPLREFIDFQNQKAFTQYYDNSR